ncbi:MAG: hypothetical protein C0491_04565 [Novosphingobium sp.]|nr:hypothetical protein [Novosphingobium sp.]
MEQTQLQTADKADKAAAFLEAFSRTDNIARRLENVLVAMDRDLNEILESPGGNQLSDHLKQVLGLAQIAFDYRDELARCHETMWANQPADLFPA